MEEDGDNLIDVTIIVNILLQKAKDAQAESSIFANCRAEKLRESENIHFDPLPVAFSLGQVLTRFLLQNIIIGDLAPSTAKRAQGESFNTISSTLTLFLSKSKTSYLLQIFFQSSCDVCNHILSLSLYPWPHLFASVAPTKSLYLYMYLYLHCPNLFASVCAVE